MHFDTKSAVVLSLMIATAFLVVSLALQYFKGRRARKETKKRKNNP